MDDLLRKLANEPLVRPGEAMHRAQALGGPKKPRGQRSAEVVVSLPKLTKAELREREAKDLEGKQGQLLDYYATTELPVERVAHHVGFYKQVEVGRTEDTDEPIYERQLDLERTEAALKWRRDHA